MDPKTPCLIVLILAYAVLPVPAAIRMELATTLSGEGGTTVTQRLTAAQYAAGFALVRIATNAAAPWPDVPTAAAYAPWELRGGSEDTVWLAATNWSFVLGTNPVEGVHVAACGALSFGAPENLAQAAAMPGGTNAVLAPLRGAFDFLPPRSRFWHAVTPSNSFLFTWENLVAGGDTNASVSFQTELFTNGDFVYRYAIPSNSSLSLFSSSFTNFVIGAQNNGGGETYALDAPSKLADGLELHWRAFGLLDPEPDDHDGDGLTTYDELMLYGTAPVLPDTDHDGLNDGDEVALGTDPLATDSDHDGLTDGDEVHVYGTDPLNADTDGDGLPDAWEVEYGFDPLVSGDESSDPDGDGLTNADEYGLGTDPLDFDTDGDLLPDGWEVLHGLNPLTYDGPSSPSWDADGDGLGLFDEYRYCTDIANPDTDGDGVSDGDEVPHSPGSCPNDADDGGNPTNCVTLNLTVGDPSGSHSERWTLNVFDSASGRQVVRHCDDGFGDPGTAEYALVKGKTYTFSLSWVATDPEYDDTPKPDYDWQALINGSTNLGVRAALYGTGAFIVGDPGRLLTGETQGNAVNLTLGKEGKIIVPKIVTETVATSPSDRTRKTVGVGEEVNLTLLPEGMGGVLWNMTEGSGQISGYTGDTITFTAPDRATNTTITVDTDAGTVGSVTFHVIEPSEIFFENKSFFLPIYNPNGYVSSSNFVLSYLANIYIKPDTVNFQKLCLFESAADVDPSTPGWRAFIEEIRQHPHQPNGPHAMTETVVAGKGTLMAEPDQIRGYTPNGPFEPVVADWNIQWSYKLNNTTLFIETIIERFSVSVPTNPPSMNARFTIEKKTSGITIGSGDQDAQWIGNEPTE